MNKKSLMGIFPTMLLVACQFGGTNANVNEFDSFVTMPLESTTCFPSQFFSADSIQYYMDFGASDYCAPYVIQTTQSSVLTPAVVDQIVAYYYGDASLDSTCPAIAYQSELAFSSNSPYSQATLQVVESAYLCVDVALNTNSIKNPMFVFDIDDTLLGGYIADCQNSFGAYDAEAWSNAKTDNAFGPTPYVSQLLQYAFDNNITVAMITGRNISDTNVTIQNLKAAYPQYTTQINNMVAQHLLYLRPPTEASWSTDVYKNSTRQELIERGYNIVLNIGDQYSDLDYTYPYSNQPYCSYKVPNFMYYIQ